VSQTLGASQRRVCRTLAVSRSSPRPLPPVPGRIDELLAERIHQLIQRFPAWGYRRVWAWLKYREGLTVNKKAVYRIFRLKRWFVNQRKATPRPRVKSSRSVAGVSNERWAMDVTHIDCGKDGWGHLAAVIDCCDRQIVGYEFALRARAKEAERALEEACLGRFGTLRPEGAVPVIRSDNGLIFQSRSFRAACKDYRLSQEFVTPYTPEQNGMIERFFRSLKEECVWLENFENFEQARAAVAGWIRFYNSERPHQSLNYKSPEQFRTQQAEQVA
jgi:putative transposase